MKGNPTAIRWGDRRPLTVGPGPSSASEDQFVDLDFPDPHELVLSLMATSSAPVAGLAVTWKLFLGAGAAMIVEPITVPVSDEVAPIPLVVRRSVSKLRITAIVSSTIPGVPRDVTLSAAVGPVSRDR